MILQAARDLRMAQVEMAEVIEQDTAVVTSAVDALTHSSDRMNDAQGRLGMLRKMSEGRSWWGRMLLYAWIAALWIVAILLVFVAPKLRF